MTLPEGVSIEAITTDGGLPRTTLVHFWRQVSGPDDALFVSLNSGDTDVTFPVDGTYQLRFTASDGELDTSDEICATAEPNLAAAQDV